MGEEKAHLLRHLTWARIKQSDVAAVGHVHVTRVILEPAAAADYIEIYDGVDPTAGKLFAIMHAATRTTRTMNLGDGVHFDRGVYIEGSAAGVRSTVCFYDPDAD